MTTVLLIIGLILALIGVPMIIGVILAVGELLLHKKKSEHKPVKVLMGAGVAIIASILIAVPFLYRHELITQERAESGYVDDNERISEVNGQSVRDNIFIPVETYLSNRNIVGGTLFLSAGLYFVVVGVYSDVRSKQFRNSFGSLFALLMMVAPSGVMLLNGVRSIPAEYLAIPSEELTVNEYNLRAEYVKDLIKYDKFDQTVSLYDLNTRQIKELRDIKKLTDDDVKRLREK